jgi:hypothetical protein
MMQECGGGAWGAEILCKIMWQPDSRPGALPAHSFAQRDVMRRGVHREPRSFQG